MGNGMPPINPFAGMSFNKKTPFGTPATAMDDAASNSGAGGWIATGAAASSALGEMMPAPYKQEIGMEKPNFFKEMLNAQFTGMGASVAGPWGALVGGIIDTGKNIGSYVNKQAKWNTALNRYENAQQQEQRMQSMGQDYTGYARYGTKTPYQYGNGGGVPVEMERNEIVVMPQQDGSYQMMGETGANAPMHEQGGVKTTLPEGALVFPQQYMQQVKQAMGNGDWATMDVLSQQMLQGAQAAAQQGQPYSSGGMPMFNNGGKVAEAIRSYDASTDTERKNARNMMSQILMEPNIDQDEKDLLLMGLIAKTAPNDPIVAKMKDLHPEHYGYFTGTEKEWKKAPMGVQDMFDAQNPFGYSSDADNENNRNVNAMHSALQNRVQHGERIDAGVNKGKYRGADGAIVDENPMPQAGTTPQTPTTTSTSATPSTATGMDRTSTRHAAMKAGIYQDAEGRQLTYWDDKTGKRMFTADASRYGLTGEFNANAKPTQQFKQQLVQSGANQQPQGGGTPYTQPKAGTEQPKANVQQPAVPTQPVMKAATIDTVPMPDTNTLKRDTVDNANVPMPQEMNQPSMVRTSNTGLEQVIQQYAQHINRRDGASNINMRPEKIMQYVMSLVQNKMSGKAVDTQRAINDAKAGGFYDSAFQGILDGLTDESVPSFRSGGKTPYMKGGKSC